MARKCKCKICKAEITTDTAFKVIVNNKNQYYCNEKEYNNMIKDKNDKNKMFEYIYDILEYEKGMVSPSILKKKINVLCKFYPYEVISQCFEDNLDTILYWWNLENKFNSEYGKISYIMVIIENKINDTYKAWKIKEQIKKKEIINKTNTVTIDFEEQTNSRKKKDITSFLD